MYKPFFSNKNNKNGGIPPTQLHDSTAIASMVNHGPKLSASDRTNPVEAGVVQADVKPFNLPNPNVSLQSFLRFIRVLTCLLACWTLFIVTFIVVYQMVSGLTDAIFKPVDYYVTGVPFKPVKRYVTGRGPRNEPLLDFIYSAFESLRAVFVAFLNGLNGEWTNSDDYLNFYPSVLWAWNTVCWFCSEAPWVLREVALGNKRACHLSQLACVYLLALLPSDTDFILLFLDRLRLLFIMPFIRLHRSLNGLHGEYTNDDDFEESIDTIIGAEYHFNFTDPELGYDFGVGFFTFTEIESVDSDGHLTYRFNLDNDSDEDASVDAWVFEMEREEREYSIVLIAWQEAYDVWDKEYRDEQKVGDGPGQLCYALIKSWQIEDIMIYGAFAINSAEIVTVAHEPMLLPLDPMSRSTQSIVEFYTNLTIDGIASISCDHLFAPHSLSQCQFDYYVRCQATRSHARAMRGCVRCPICKEYRDDQKIGDGPPLFAPLHFPIDGMCILCTANLVSIYLDSCPHCDYCAICYALDVRNQTRLRPGQAPRCFQCNAPYTVAHHTATDHVYSQAEQDLVPADAMNQAWAPPALIANPPPNLAPNNIPPLPPPNLVPNNVPPPPSPNLVPNNMPLTPPPLLALDNNPPLPPLRAWDPYHAPVYQSLNDPNGILGDNVPDGVDVPYHPQPTPNWLPRLPLTYIIHAFELGRAGLERSLESIPAGYNIVVVLGAQVPVPLSTLLLHARRRIGEIEFRLPCPGPRRSGLPSIRTVPRVQRATTLIDEQRYVQHITLEDSVQPAEVHGDVAHVWDPSGATIEIRFGDHCERYLRQYPDHIPSCSGAYLDGTQFHTTIVRRPDGADYVSLRVRVMSALPHRPATIRPPPESVLHGRLYVILRQGLCLTLPVMPAFLFSGLWFDLARAIARHQIRTLVRVARTVLPITISTIVRSVGPFGPLLAQSDSAKVLHGLYNTITLGQGSELSSIVSPVISDVTEAAANLLDGPFGRLTFWGLPNLVLRGILQIQRLWDYLAPSTNRVRRRDYAYLDDCCSDFQVRADIDCLSHPRCVLALRTLGLNPASAGDLLTHNRKLVVIETAYCPTPLSSITRHIHRVVGVQPRFFTHCLRANSRYNNLAHICASLLVRHKFLGILGASRQALKYSSVEEALIDANAHTGRVVSLLAVALSSLLSPVLAFYHSFYYLAKTYVSNQSYAQSQNQPIDEMFGDFHDVVLAPGLNLVVSPPASGKSFFIRGLPRNLVHVISLDDAFAASAEHDIQCRDGPAYTSRFIERYRNLLTTALAHVDRYLDWHTQHDVPVTPSAYIDLTKTGIYTSDIIEVSALARIEFSSAMRSQSTVSLETAVQTVNTYLATNPNVSQPAATARALRTYLVDLFGKHVAPK